jgi:transcriptional regulator with XRE-family HTH domain
MNNSRNKHTHIDYKKLVGKNVRHLRVSAKLRQDEVASQCGIFRTYLSRIENGHANPTLLTLISLATCLRVEPSELFKSPVAVVFTLSGP